MQHIRGTLPILSSRLTSLSPDAGSRPTDLFSLESGRPACAVTFPHFVELIKQMRGEGESETWCTWTDSPEGKLRARLARILKQLVAARFFEISVTCAGGLGLFWLESGHRRAAVTLKLQDRKSENVSFFFF